MTRAAGTQNKVAVKNQPSVGQQPQSAMPEFEARGSVGPMVVYGSLAVISFIIICLHGFVSPKLWSNIDVFAMQHYTKEGESPVKRRTALGFSFTVAFIPIAGMVITGLSVSNRPIETPSLQAANSLPASTAHLSVHLMLPLESHVDVCRDVIIMDTDAAGCNQTSSTPHTNLKTCTFTGVNCTLGLNTVFRFTVPWNQRWVKWNVTAETASAGEGKTISGEVVCDTPNGRIKGTNNIDIQAMASYRNDTTSKNSGDATTGYDLYPLPHAPPNMRFLDNETTLVAADASSVTDDWYLEITLRRSPLIHMVYISRPLSPFQLMSLCLTTVLSFLGIWRGFFKFTEYYLWLVATMRTRKNARRRKRRARGEGDAGETKNDDDGLEMQAAVKIGTASTALFDDQQLPSMPNPAYDHHRASIGDYAQRTARLEKRVDEAKTGAYKTDMCMNEMKSRVGVAETRADLAEKRADEAERLNEKRFMEMEQRLERAVNKKEGGGLAL